MSAATLNRVSSDSQLWQVRIRMVECPSYAPDLPSALRRYVQEGGLLSLYDGLIPLLVRQVRREGRVTG